MSPRFKGLWRPSLFKLMLMILLSCLLACASLKSLISGIKVAEAARASEPTGSNARSRSQSAPTISDSDPMEPCYLSNNRASESLTISESTPVGTVVGEIMVNGDSSPNGNIELSIKMPGGNAQTAAAAAATGESSRYINQRQARQTNGLSASSSSSLANGSSSSQATNGRSSHHQMAEGKQVASAAAARSRVKSARDLNTLIDLMPPLTIEHDTKRLILAKKLDRENLDSYIMAGGYQSSQLGHSQSSSSSASLTVHIKCQLRLNPSGPAAGNQTTAPAPRTNQSLDDNQSFTNNKGISTLSQQTKHQANSILIPIHLIVTDENDNWPIFINSPYILDLNESALIGTPLPGNEIVAVDNDQQGPLSTIEYSIVGGSFHSDSFGFLNPLDSRSLIVKDNRLLDYESQSKLTLKVMARDQGEPPNWAISPLHINLFDQDDLNPVFSEDKYLGYVRDNRPGEVVEMMPKRLVARDGDKTINAPISYSFHMKTNHSIHFELDPDLGRLSLKKSLPEDGEQLVGSPPYCLLIRATQADNPKRWSLTMVQVRLAGREPFIPGSGSIGGQLEQLMSIGGDGSKPETMNSDNESSQELGQNRFRFAQPNFTVQVSEAAPPGYTLLNLRAAFGNNANQNSVTYQLLDNELEYFNLDQHSGRLSLNKSLDYELYRQLSVRVLATTEPGSRNGVAGNNLPRLACDLVRVNILILAHNDFAPEFSHEQYNFQLSVSDLIANFDLPKFQAAAAAAASGTTTSGSATGGNDDFDDDTRVRDHDGATTNELRRRLTKRFGELDGQGDEFNSDEPLPWAAMRLGQVYCSDRDFGDRVSLQLVGSKANLFHLTQDGRLYLPLVNTSTLSAAAAASSSSSSQQEVNTKLPHLLVSSTGEHPKHSDHSGTSGKQRAIDNQFMHSRKLFALRRHDYRTQAREFPDRIYLNYLLGEFSNLGRLRLKVLATDDGQPQQRQATALIVIAVISIDNFILQRAPNLPPPANGNNNPSLINQIRTTTTTGGGGRNTDAGAIQLTNDTSYDTSRPEMDSNRPQYYSQGQVMMIPATNGRSYVQINPDIISNLISQNVFQSSSSSSNNWTSGDQSRRAGGQNQLGPGGSNSTTLPGGIELQSGAESQIHQSHTMGPGNRFQPPSLLLVDDDGAKFVAMPAAIEVYNQQVQEAAAEQQRQRSQASSTTATTAADGAPGRAQEESLFQQLKSQLGFSGSSHRSPQDPPAPSSGSLYWLNLSTAIMLHLVALVIVVTLVSRLRCSLSGGGGDNSTGGGGGGGAGGLWSARMSRPSWGQGGRGHSAVASILDSAGTYASHQQKICASSSSGSDGSDNGSSFGFPHSNQQSNLNLQQQNAQRPFMGASNKQQLASSIVVPADTTNGVRQQALSSSSGVVVSAVSNGYKLNRNLDPRKGISADVAKQQNLFGHLKVTLNRMLDGGSGGAAAGDGDPSDGGRSCMIGQVSIRPLDSDSIKFESLASGEQPATRDGPVGGLNESTTCSTVEANRASNINEMPLHATRSSTFVGAQQVQSVAVPSIGSGSVRLPGSGHKQVVSISVSGPKLDPGGGTSGPHQAIERTNQRLTTAGSSPSSSVVSLISMSSSISNKINAAVESQRPGEYTATGSDVSSLDSSTLFNVTTNNTTTISTSSTKLTGPKVSATGQSSDSMAAGAGRGAAPPPPPPPPPPCMVQVGGRLVIESLKQAARKQQSPAASDAGLGGSSDSSYRSSLKLDHTSCSKPFSAPPLEAEVDSVARRPLPQNPLHVKLRQQAASAPSGPLDHGAGKKKHEQQQQQQMAAASTNRKHCFRASAGGANRIPIDLRATKAGPPTPPPLPGQPPALHAKTVSPTTSVDRGYESFQSYTSSSQQQQQLAGRSPASTRGPSTRASDPVGTTSGRIHSSSSGGTSGADTAARVRRASQTLASGNCLVPGGHGQATISTVHRLGSRRYHQQLPSSRIISDNNMLPSQGLGSRPNSSKQSLSHSGGNGNRLGGSLSQKSGRLHQLNLSEHDRLQREDSGEEEDGDFYYCYNQLANTIGGNLAFGIPGGQVLKNQIAFGPNEVLSDYASHAYLKDTGNGVTDFAFDSSQAHTNHYDPTGLRFMGPSVATKRANNGSDLMLMGQTAYHQGAAAETHHHNRQANHHDGHHQHHHGHKQSNNQQQQQQRHLSHRSHLYSAAAAAAAASKKQLTWSDQVGGTG